jgi:hypothetical protein
VDLMAFKCRTLKVKDIMVWVLIEFLNSYLENLMNENL